MREVIFDVETKNLFRDVMSNDPADLGVSIVSMYVRTISGNDESEGIMLSFWEHEFSGMWKYFQNADRIIGFNTIKFDVPALQPYAPAGFEKLPHFDLLDIIKNILGFRLSLNTLATDTLGTPKTDNGTNAVTYFRSGDQESLKKLKSYCEADVVITKQLYDYAVTNKHLNYTDKWNTKKIITVDFSYPEKMVALKSQTSLF